jgi:hypothetical protein
MRHRALSRDERSGGAGSFGRKFIEKLAAAGAGDFPAEALAVAATHGPLPPGVTPVEARDNGGILDPPAAPRRRFMRHFTH